MAINYRNDPIHERLRESGGSFIDPALWFTSGSPYNRDPYTMRFDTRAFDPIWFRMVQGSHEEQHSFQIHGMRWREFRDSPDSAIRNQQSFGISEAFTFKQEEVYGDGDYMYKLSGADDLWLGCWGIVRAFSGHEAGAPLPLTHAAVAERIVRAGGDPRVPRQAERRKLIYREPDLIDPLGLVYRLTKIVGPNGVRSRPSEDGPERAADPSLPGRRDGQGGPHQRHPGRRGHAAGALCPERPGRGVRRDPPSGAAGL
jgi:hypothetical protein